MSSVKLLGTSSASGTYGALQRSKLKNKSSRVGGLHKGLGFGNNQPQQLEIPEEDEASPLHSYKTAIKSHIPLTSRPYRSNQGITNKLAGVLESLKPPSRGRND